MASGKQDPKPGDLIEIKRPLYEHWALYLEDEYVIHVTCEDKGIQRLSPSGVAIVAKTAKVKKQLLKEVVGDNDWEVNNKYDRSRTPLPVEEIIRRAKSYIDMEVTYKVLGKNCEHFVTMLRYGESVSDQARSAIEEMKDVTYQAVSVLIGGSGVVALTAVGVAPAAAVGVAVGAATVGTALGA
ncbi:phospholipid-metabolizing enzyme A-C1-like, partial [Neopelma chrysocephalum]|uniref:phospholipid-metabolizing enzyme A-C1-like n=1 Tax=Neopelma chrysocephalum TaxID=114329 RepID=UPI000FCCF55A